MAGEIEGGGQVLPEDRPSRREERPSVPEREQPVERLEGAQERPSQQLRGTYQNMVRDGMRAVDDYFTSHPEQDSTEARLSAYQRIFEGLGGQLDQMEQLARSGMEHGVGESRERPEKEGWQWIRVKSSVGIPRYVHMPISDEGKRYYVGEVLARIEATPESEGGFTDRTTLEETALAIASIIENPNEYTQADRSLGEKLKREFVARLKVHGVYQQFSHAPSTSEVMQALGSVTPDELNTLFIEIPKVAQAFGLLEERGEDFLEASEEERQNIRQQIAEAIVEVKPDVPDLRTIDLFWAERIAERLWEITGRRAIRDRLIAKDVKEGEDPVEALKKAYNERDKATFLGGGVTAGNFHLRKALQGKRWIRQVSGGFRPFFQLLPGWDLGAKDLFTRLVETTYDAKKKEKYGSRALNNDEKRSLAQEICQIFKDKDGNPLPVEDVIEEKKDEKTGEKTGEIDIKWPMMTNWEEDPELGEKATKHPYANYLQKIDWSKVDFASIGGGKGTYPFLEWVLYHIHMPTEALGTMIGKAELFLQNPTFESLKKVENAFNYLGPKGFTNKEALFTNYMNFAGMDYQKETGRRNLTKVELDRQIGNAVVDKFIGPDKAKSLRDELFELRIPGIKKPIRGAWLREAKTLLYSISWLGGLWGFIKEFFKSAFSVK